LKDLYTLLIVFFNPSIVKTGWQSAQSNLRTEYEKYAWPTRLRQGYGGRAIGHGTPCPHP
jgi:hypothetical protein